MEIPKLREIFGLLDAQGANEVHVVTSGYFTDDAKEFARNKPMRLIDGTMLAQLVKSAWSSTSPPQHMDTLRRRHELTIAKYVLEK